MSRRTKARSKARHPRNTCRSAQQRRSARAHGTARWEHEGSVVLHPHGLSSEGHSDALSVHTVRDIEEVGQESWDECNASSDPNPFLSFDFLHSLEHSGSAIGAEGWHPRHLVALRGSEVVGVAPAYLKDHSFGEARPSSACDSPPIPPAMKPRFFLLCACSRSSSSTKASHTLFAAKASATTQSFKIACLSRPALAHASL